MLISAAEIGKRAVLWGMGLSIIIFFYGLGKFGFVFSEPHMLPMTAADQAIPFVPWTRITEVKWPRDTPTKTARVKLA